MEKIELENILIKYKIKLPKNVLVEDILADINNKEKCKECQRFSYLYPYCPYCGRKLHKPIYNILEEDNDYDLRRKME